MAALQFRLRGVWPRNWCPFACDLSLRLLPCSVPKQPWGSRIAARHSGLWRTYRYCGAHGACRCVRSEARRRQHALKSTHPTATPMQHRICTSPMASVQSHMRTNATVLGLHNNTQKGDLFEFKHPGRPHRVATHCQAQRITKGPIPITHVQRAETYDMTTAIA